MQAYRIHVCVAVFAMMLAACGGVAESKANRPINPGDKIGDFLITTADGEDVVFVSQLHCPYDSNTSTESCEQPVGTKVNVSQGIYADPSIGKTLDALWSEQTHEMTIEGRPVNLQAFGSVDFSHPMVGTVRVWNVVIVGDQPGTITAQSKGVVGGEAWKYTAALTFSAP
jgi:hypothetical protein